MMLENNINECLKTIDRVKNILCENKINLCIKIENIDKNENCFYTNINLNLNSKSDFNYEKLEPGCLSNLSSNGINFQFQNDNIYVDTGKYDDKFIPNFIVDSYNNGEYDDLIEPMFSTTIEDKSKNNNYTNLPIYFGAPIGIRDYNFYSYKDSIIAIHDKNNYKNIDIKFLNELNIELYNLINSLQKDESIYFVEIQLWEYGMITSSTKIATERILLGMRQKSFKYLPIKSNLVEKIEETLENCKKINFKRIKVLNIYKNILRDGLRVLVQINNPSTLFKLLLSESLADFIVNDLFKEHRFTSAMIKLRHRNYDPNSITLEPYANYTHCVAKDYEEIELAIPNVISILNAFSNYKHYDSDDVYCSDSIFTYYISGDINLIISDIYPVNNATKDIFDAIKLESDVDFLKIIKTIAETEPRKYINDYIFNNVRFTLALINDDSLDDYRDELEDVMI